MTPNPMERKETVGTVFGVKVVLETDIPGLAGEKCLEKAKEYLDDLTHRGANFVQYPHKFYDEETPMKPNSQWVEDGSDRERMVSDFSSEELEVAKILGLKLPLNREHWCQCFSIERSKNRACMNHSYDVSVLFKVMELLQSVAKEQVEMFARELFQAINEASQDGTGNIRASQPDLLHIEALKNIIDTLLAKHTGEEK